jgi:D-sedoheptulose 7-phosphate isomerase
MDNRVVKSITGRSFNALAALLPRALARNEAAVAAAVEVISGALQTGRKVMLCGNGGSAADAQHFAAELVGKFYRKRRALPALSLTTDTSALTSIGNDLAFRHVFSRQVEGLGSPGDVLVCITTSGKSANVVAAARAARGRGITVVSLLGSHCRTLAPLSNVVLSVPSSDTPRVQEVHALLGHIICQAVEEAVA